MKRLTEEEFIKLSLRGKGKSSHFFNTVLNMKVGEIILIERKEWNRKKSPSAMVRRIEKTSNMLFLVNGLTDKSGWTIKRTK